jgi:NAD(P)H dehydrogenase (quinone)
MTRPTILITGATGKTGSAVVQALLAGDHPVRALVRARDARSRGLEQRGAEVVVADMFDYDQLLAAMHGAHRAYFVPPFHPYMIQSAVTFAVAARDAHLETVVQMGQWLSHRAHPAIMTRQTWLTDQMLPHLGAVGHTIINPGMFADNFLRTIDVAALLGMNPVLTGAGRAAPVSTEDLARTVVAALLEPGRHAGHTYRPTGPVLLSGSEMGDIIAGVVGHRVISVDLPFWMFRKIARRQGVNPLEVSGFRYYAEEMRRGTFEFDGGVTTVVEDLTGSPAETFETTARRYAAMPFARRTLSNRLRTAATFAMIPFYPGYHIDRWERLRGIPVPPASSLSIQDARWRDEHRAGSSVQAPR